MTERKWAAGSLGASSGGQPWNSSHLTAAGVPPCAETGVYDQVSWLTRLEQGGRCVAGERPRGCLPAPAAAHRALTRCKPRHTSTHEHRPSFSKLALLGADQRRGVYHGIPHACDVAFWVSMDRPRHLSPQARGASRPQLIQARPLSTVAWHSGVRGWRPGVQAGTRSGTTSKFDGHS